VDINGEARSGCVEIGGGMEWVPGGGMWTCMTGARQLQKERLAVGERVLAFVEFVRNPLG